MAFVKGRSTNIWKFDEDLFRSMEVFEALLFRLGMTSYAPELVDLFGKDGFIRFMDVFSGTTFKVPPRQILLDCVRDTVIYHTIENDGENKAQDLSIRFQKTVQWILKRHQQVRRFLEDGGGYLDRDKARSRKKLKNVVTRKAANRQKGEAKA